MSHEAIRWLITAGLAILGFVLGGGWPARAYRRWSDSDLYERLKEKFVPTAIFEAHVRENEMRHQRGDEVMSMLHDNQRAILQLSGAVERHTEALKYFGDEMREVRDDVEELKRSRPASP